MSPKIVVGIDVSKHFSNVCILSPHDEIVFESRIHHDSPGFSSLLKQIKKISRNHLDNVVAVMESTAHYHLIIHQYLQSCGIETIIINPLQSGGTKNLEIRKIKNDRTDAKRLAFLYRMQVLKPTRIDPMLCAALKDLTRQRACLIHDKVRISNKLTCLLDQSFPGYQKIFSKISSKSSLGILIEYPTPELVLSAKKDSLRRTMAKASQRLKTSSYIRRKTDLLVSTAKEARAILIARDSFAPLISTFARMMFDLEESSFELERTIISLAKSDQQTWESVQLLSSIPGIGEYSAVVILAEIGDISRFSKPKQLVAYAGLDSSVSQSGQYSNSSGRISKRGSAHLRSVLSVCTHVAVHNCVKGAPANPVLSKYYAQKAASKPAKVAQTACMHKMINYIYAVLRDRKPFSSRSPEAHIEIMKTRCKMAA